MTLLEAAGLVALVAAAFYAILWVGT